ncbi:MAG TPA: hypothetical protein VMK32_10270 [Burkholderiaceae bacterium]|nr:hypothetical protein [Burkholderiaceae bacterium]
MAWQSVETIPISVDSAITPRCADAVRSALLSRALPLARLVDGRAEPLATASLLVDGSSLALLTAAHVFDHANAGDLAVPLPREGRWACLRSARTRVLAQPERDIALVMIGDGATARRLRANWTAVARSHLTHRPVSGAVPCVYAVAGYPVSQVRRIDGSVYMKPLVLFTTLLDADRLAYAHTATRVDGLHIHTPELDGVSGALIWAVHEDRGGECLLLGAAVQVAFMHGRYVRTEPLSQAALSGHLRPH